MFKQRYLLTLCLVGILLNLLSRYNGTGWWHIANMLIAPSLFMLFSWSGMKFNRFCLLGSTYVFFIYIVHPLVSTCYNALRGNPGVVESWLRPIIVLVSTVLLAMAYYHIKTLILARLRH